MVVVVSYDFFRLTHLFFWWDFYLTIPLLFLDYFSLFFILSDCLWSCLRGFYLNTEKVLWRWDGALCGIADPDLPTVKQKNFPSFSSALAVPAACISISKDGGYFCPPLHPVALLFVLTFLTFLDFWNGSDQSAFSQGTFHSCVPILESESVRPVLLFFCAKGGDWLVFFLFFVLKRKITMHCAPCVPLCGWFFVFIGNHTGK